MCHYIYLNHFTDKNGIKSIIKSKKINPSRITGRDAIAGQGVYLTKLSPLEHTKEQIAKNNWGSADYVAQGRVDYVVSIKFWVPDATKTLIQVPKDQCWDREISLYKDPRGIDLSNVEYRIFEWDEFLDWADKYNCIRSELRSLANQFLLTDD